MKDSDTIKTIGGFSESGYKEKGSRFIASVFQVVNEDQVFSCLTEIKKKYFDASHYCFAYKFQNEKTRYSDAGEPSGTAGIRILNAIEHSGLTNTLIIVTRYFGGTKLGTGHLGKAYYTSASEVLKKAKILIKTSYARVCVSIDFVFLPGLLKLLARKEMGIREVGYKTDSEVEFLIKTREIESFKQNLRDISKGTASFRILEKIYK